MTADSTITPVPEPAPGMPGTPASPQKRGRTRLTRRERNRRVWLLAILLLLLLLLAYMTYFWTQNRRMPAFGLRDPGAQTVNPPQYLYSITGSGANRLNRPVGVALSDGKLYVVDFGKRRISVFTEKGSFVKAFNKTATGPLQRPNIIAIRGNELWVTDRLKKNIYIYTLDGAFLRVFEPKGGKLNWGPFAIAFAPDGSFVVSDVGERNRHKLHFFKPDGTRVAVVGRTTLVNDLIENPGSFMFPSGVAIGENGEVFVSDGDNRRVQVFDKTGKFVRFIDTSGVPRGSDTDTKNRLYVADALAHNVDVYDFKGARLTQFGSHGFGPGQFSFPGYVAVNDKTSRIFISDRENNQVQVWGWPKAELPPVAKPKTPLGWLGAAAPFFLLPFLFFYLRKRRVVVTPEFVEALITAGLINDVAEKRRLQLICPENDHVFYRDRNEEGVNLGDLVEPEVHSQSDASALADRLECTEYESVLLSMGARVKGIGTQNMELRRLALLADVRALDVDEFREMFLSKRRSNKAER